MMHDLLPAASLTRTRMLALVVLLATTFTALTACEQAVGANSPQALAQAYLTAYQKEDFAGMLACFTPTEQKALAPYLDTLNTRWRLLDEESMATAAQVQSFTLEPHSQLETDRVEVPCTLLLNGGVIWRARLECVRESGRWFYRRLQVDRISQRDVESGLSLPAVGD